MRDEDFKQRLTEVCEWEIPLDPDHKLSGQHNRQKKLQRLGESCFNPTYPPKIVKLKHQAKACEDCGKMVEGRCKDLQIYKNKNTVGIKEKCNTCGLHKDPYTGEFTLTGTEASIKWNSYAKGVKKRYNPKVLVEVKPHTQTQDAVVIRYRPEEPFKI